MATLLKKNSTTFLQLLTLFRMGLFGAADGGEQKGPPSLKFVTPYLKKIEKCINLVTNPFSSADISMFSPENSNIELATQN